MKGGRERPAIIICYRILIRRFYLRREPTPLTQKKGHPMIGQTVSHYQITEKLGQGGMGVVYKAKDTKLDRFVALKFLPPHLSMDDEAKQRFIHEAKAASALDHVNICTIHDIGETDEGRLFIAMTCYEGETLKKKIERGALAVPKVVDYATQIAEGLGRAHEEGIVHRDVKPANVMVTSRERVKILDFGLAKMADVKLTKTGSTLGTVAYMSPEQARGEAVDQRTDIWALGVVLYEMLAGRRPFPGEYEQAVVYAVLNLDPEPITTLRADLPAVLGRVVRKALEKSPARRYPNMGALIEDLETVSSGETAAPELEKSIVVLPFTNLSPNPDDAYFSDGLTEELITDLSRISELRVIASASAFRLQGTDKELRTIGRELQVRYAVAGRVRKAGQSVRITAQLIDLRDDSLVWGDKYSGSLENVFELQEQVSRAIADALQVQLRPPSRAPKPGAVEAYLKGRHFFRQATTDGFQKALECFRNATEVDPNYAPAFAGLAYTYVLLTAGWEALPAHEAMPKAETAARQAFELDPMLPEAHVAHGLVATYLYWDLATAEDAFREALRLNPNYAEAHRWYTAPLIWLDTRFTQALEHARRAVELNPVDPWSWFQLACTHYFSRDFEGAINQSRQLINIEPLWALGHYYLGTCLATTGKAAEAAECINRAIELDGRGVHCVAWLGLSYAIAGKDVEARACLAELETHEREGRSVWAWKLVIHAGLGDSDAIMRCLEEAFQERSASLLYHLTHPLVDGVRTHPQFVDLLRRMNVEHLATYRPDSPWEPTVTS